eukprot:4656937-Pleurochrysis_carterae.AAC.2
MHAPTPPRPAAVTRLSAHMSSSTGARRGRAVADGGAAAGAAATSAAVARDHAVGARARHTHMERAAAHHVPDPVTRQNH